MQPSSASPGGVIRNMVHQLRLFFIALQFFTRLPVPRWVGFDPAWLQHAVRYFPAVGLLVGVTTAIVYLLSAMLWPQLVAVLLSTIAGIYLTGAFHEDGFSDVCDGLGGAMEPQRALAIMKDSRIGAYGAIGIGLLLALKCAVLSCLPRHSVAAVLMAAHPLSRLAATALIWRLEYVKAEGKAKPLAQQMSNAEFVIALATVVLPLTVLSGGGWLTWQALAAGVVAVVLITVWIARKFVRRIGGYTGDCLGAAQQLAEAAFYLAALAALG